MNLMEDWALTPGSSFSTLGGVCAPTCSHVQVYVLAQCTHICVYAQVCVVSMYEHSHVHAVHEFRHIHESIFIYLPMDAEDQALLFILIFALFLRPKCHHFVLPRLAG